MEFVEHRGLWLPAIRFQPGPLGRQYFELLIPWNWLSPTL